LFFSDAHTSLNKFAGANFSVRNDQLRSMQIAVATIEQSAMGNISQPPFNNNSNTRHIPLFSMYKL
jgi:hypothetical protein